nr:WRKY1 [Ipomoea trifida]GMD57187.1 probable WRKY transcription factor 7 [Ipomoea batatas]
MDQESEPVALGQTRVVENSEKLHTGASKMYSLLSIPRFPPHPHNHHQLLKNGSVPTAPKRKESSTTMNFSASQTTSSSGSFITLLTGDT